MSRYVVLPSLKHPVLPRILRRLPEAKTHLLFIFNAFMERSGKVSGPSFHSHLAALLQSAVNDEAGLQEWTREKFIGTPMRFGKAFEAARKQACLWIEEGKWVASWEGVFPPPGGLSGCPQVLFGQGRIQGDQGWAAFFNSRKAKLVSPRAEWLQALRTMLSVMASQKLGFASSLGTTTYDLVTAGAELFGTGLLLLVPQALEDTGKTGDSPPGVLAASPNLTLTCLTKAVDCPKPTRMVCRDRLLAFIADVHCLLELRPGGNLQKILERQQQIEPRLRWSFIHEGGKVDMVSGRNVLQNVPQTTLSLSRNDPGATRRALSKSSVLHPPSGMLDTQAIQWQDYLYHYTRSCPGPWPGQTYRDYLKGLLDDEPLGEHTALAALVRILCEGRIRASSKMVRGSRRVVSWTSRPPQELSAIRHWNTALIRWTFEPFGLGVKRSLLKKLGARPVIYAASAVYQKLPWQERFRFQLHDPPHCSWKNEREWRLPHDLTVKGLAPDQAFLFMPTLADAEASLHQTASTLSIVVLG